LHSLPTPLEETQQDLAKKEASEKARLEKEAKANDKRGAEEKAKLEKDEREAVLGSDEENDKFNIGDKVRTVATKQKDKFDNMLAEVVSIKKTTYRVKILEGPAKLTMKDFLFKNLTAINEEEVDPAQVDAKRQKLAASLFGAVL
jgi:sRNA-binding protein